MKRKTGMALLALSSGLMMVFAADVDKCTEKYKSCTEICGNSKAQCLARGNEKESCNFRMKQCVADCEKDLKTCQAKSQTKSPPKTPPKTPPKK
jgi:hypothetical protein